MGTKWEKTTRQTKTKVNGQKIIKNLMEIRIQDGKTVAQDKDRWKQVYVAVTGFNGFKKSEEKSIEMLIFIGFDPNNNYLLR